MPPSAPNPPPLLYDGFDALTSGMDSGIAPLSLKKTNIAYGTNTTVRGGFITHRPPYSDIDLILDPSVDLTGLLFQGACYYSPNFGQESIVAQIGGRIFQFVPDTDGNAYVYDRTVRDYINGQSFTTSQGQTTANYSVTLTNINAAQGTNYASGTTLITDPSFITSTSQGSTIGYSLSGNTVTWTGNLILPSSFTGAAALVGKQVFFFTGYINNQPIRWNVSANGMSGSNPFITVTFSYSFSGTFTYSAFPVPAGEPILYFTNPAPPARVATTNVGFAAPAPGSTVVVGLQAAYPGAVGDAVQIGAGNTSIYVVSAITTEPSTSFSVATQLPSNQSNVFTYDPNPAGVRQAWLCQAEQWVIIQNGLNRPIFFDGISSRRSLTPTFIGALAESFNLPQIGQSVTIELNAPFLDAIGTFVNFTPLDLYPFLMIVTAVGVGGDPNSISVANVTGQSAVGSTIPITTPVNSTSSPSYYGVLVTPVPGGTMPAPGGTITLGFTPAYTGAVGSQVILTDGTGPLTEYTFNVTQITNGGATLTLTNVNAPAGLIVNAGYPVISETATVNELPIGRMMAYVQGRVWLALPSGTQFVAGDQVGDSSGTAQYNFDDAVLKWSVNTLQFSVPGEAGDINCIVALSSLDASLGQGPLQILCDNDIFTCSASDDATTWAATTNPILSESAIGFGGVGQNAAAVVNGDLILRSNSGWIYSLKLARQDFNQWGNMPISKEVNRIIYQENDDLLPYTTALQVNNRCLVSCSPIEQNGVIYSQGLIALDFDITSGLQGKLPSVYDGVWKDLNVLQIVGGTFNNVWRTFAFCQDTSTNTVELVELLSSGNFDNGNTLIKWSFESPMLFQSADRWINKRLELGEIYISKLVGKATIKVWYRPDFDECWHPWTSFSVCADNITSGAKQYRTRLGLGKPDTEECDDTVNKLTTDGRFFQLRFEIEGSLTFMACVAAASAQPQVIFPTPADNEGVDVELDLNPPPTMPQQAPTQYVLMYFSNPPVVYQIDPNSENLKPANPQASCLAYSASGNGSIFGWEVASQTWM